MSEWGFLYTYKVNGGIILKRNDKTIRMTMNVIKKQKTKEWKKQALKFLISVKCKIKCDIQIIQSNMTWHYIRDVQLKK